MASDDDVIRKRLLIDGDGGGDERRLNALMKLFIKWCNSPDPDISTHQRMLSFLAVGEFAVAKSSFVYEMNMKQMEKYKQLQEEIDANVSLAKKEIEKCKTELAEARLIRKNRKEYDALAGVVLQHPDRQQTEGQISELKCDLKELEANELRLVEKLDLRKKQFHALLTSINHLQIMLNEEEEEDKRSLDVDMDDAKMDTTPEELAQKT
uniref:THO complex subunit 7 homolog n=1 Tax=Ciona intestinalis TaxID=7719 RepID=UPI00006A7306|nr:THO complex subunit 7 homolog [Ciona intestinalis]|eukprot:XP_002119739.1 THO complex subunit 7 homolog [Ciona intestinalis]